MMTTQDDSDEIDLYWILFLYQYMLCMLQLQEHALITCFEEHVQEQILLNQLPAAKQWPSWGEFSQQLTDQKFRSNFRMHYDAFTYSCSNIESDAGEYFF
jgi:hypothetical protein